MMNKNLLLGVLLAGMVAAPLVMSAQKNDKEALKQAKKETYREYSRWSIGANVGMPFFRGDFNSFSHDKTYVGVMGGLQIGYQMTPTLGLSLTGDFGKNKGGAKGNELDYILKPDGDSYYGPNPPEGSLPYNSLYDEVKFMTFGLHLDINVNNFFRSNDSGTRRWTVLLSPAIYLQKFDPTVYQRADDKRFTTTDLDNKVNLGLGGDLALRFRASKHIDLQLKTGIAWVDNNKFDGITTCCTKKYNWLANASIGIVWKIGNKNKKDNLMYAPTKIVPVPPVVEKKEEPAPAPAPAPAPVKEEPKQEVAVVVSDQLPQLPAIYFKRNESKINVTKYQKELNTIVNALKEAPDANVNILGYADHTGGTAVNERITAARANALKDYLISQGISASRLTAKGMGKDTSLSGQAAYSEKARRVVVEKK
ncbi:OmpA family protein [Parabacteroides pacaensis]|uniref:OmpA family protein n=1 Tax=Parabacteroides pacaensis TaxID=2086575 RepID=UPI000D0F3DA1|nr:OmpA family protein [Parabacteroides pacaensis]